jgi:hypothetical protein
MCDAIHDGEGSADGDHCRFRFAKADDSFINRDSGAIQLFSSSTVNLVNFSGRMVES